MLAGLTKDGLSAASQVRVLVVGCGSIGKRHIRNLQSLGVQHIVACDPRPDRRAEVQEQCGVPAVDDLKEGLAKRPALAFVATPTAYHVEPALRAALQGCDLFIEKPVSHSLEHVASLLETIHEKKLVCLVGCNMRFHPAIVIIKETVERMILGPVLSVRVQAGSYLPGWHPWEDYRQGYSANQSLGGGCILDGIHEIDYLRWILGEVETVACLAGKVSNLEIDTEDVAEILLRFRSGVIAEVHLDYVQRAYGRSCQVIAQEGTLSWDFQDNTVRMFRSTTKQWEVLWQDPQFDFNQTYVDEIQHFLSCVSTRSKPAQDVTDGVLALRIALAAKRSAQEGIHVRAGELS